MKYKKPFLFLLLIMLNSSIFAYDVKIDGIFYNLNLSSKTAEVTYETTSYNSYCGDIVIPTTIKTNNVEYTVTSIGDYSFYNCDNMYSVELSSSIRRIGKWAFSGSDGLKTVVIPEGVTEIEYAIFSGCSKLNSVTMPSTLKVIGERAFYECYGLRNIVIPNGVESIGRISFQFCKNLQSIEIPNSVTEIGSSAFSGCTSLISAKLSDNIVTIPLGIFNGCSNLVTVNIPNGVKTIAADAFENCKKITSIILPKSITSIKSLAFSGCQNMTKVISQIETPFEIEEAVFKGIAIDAQLNVPTGTKSKYEVFSGWTKYFKEIIEIESPTTYSLSITASGNGSVTYGTATVKNQTQFFTVEDGTSVTVSFTPDNGYRMASVKVNNTDVTSSVSNNRYTISSISANTTLAVEFEAIPPTTYTLSVKATGNGSASYDGTTIRSKTSTFTVNEGTSATISFAPDNGYKIKNVKLNNADVTASVSNNTYTISSISANTMLEVEFEAIPVTTYTLSVKTSGNGSASYAGTTIRSKTSTFTVNEGTKVSISITPDNGYRIKSVKENDANVTSYVSNGIYTINSISRNTSIEVEFEVIPAKTFTLSIKAAGDGQATYNNVIIRNTTESFTVNEGSYATVAFNADNGYRIASVKVNNTNVTSSVSNNQYTISNITANTTLEVTFEAIPVTTYSLRVKASGNGSAMYNGTTVRNSTQTFTLEEGTNATITFSPDNGNRTSGVKVNSTDVTSQVSGNSYVVNSISANTTIEVTFVEDVNALTVDGINYTVTSQSNKTVKVSGGSIGQVLTVPATVTSNGTTWTVTGIDNDALKNNKELAAIIWNPEASFAATVSNPNLLLYVKAEEYAPSAIKNVVVNGTAANIVLVDAISGNAFYCPQSFTAQKISYQHSYSMTTGIGESRGWETIALPFDVQTITHSSKGNIKPFAKWNGEDDSKPFWLYELTGSGFAEAAGVEAYKPYIISMPNNPQYENQWLLNGTITFSASNVTIDKTEDVQTNSYLDRTFVPNFTDRDANEGYYALNVNNDYATNNSGMIEGSKFVLNMRQIHPFEAYMTTTSNAREYFDVFEEMTTAIREINNQASSSNKNVYDLQGRKVSGVKKGLYISNGHKIIIK